MSIMRAKTNHEGKTNVAFCQDASIATRALTPELEPKFDYVLKPHPVPVAVSESVKTQEAPSPCSMTLSLILPTSVIPFSRFKLV